MVVYAVRESNQNRVVYASKDLKQAQAYIIRKLGQALWPWQHGRYYCSYEIFDIYVHDVLCDCESCTGVPEACSS